MGLRVWGTTIMTTRGQKRAVCAVHSLKEAAEKFRVSKYHLRDYGCVTGNQQETAAAMAQPGVVLVRQIEWSKNNEFLTLDAWENQAD